jgi:hypothetical protein
MINERRLTESCRHLIEDGWMESDLAWVGKFMGFSGKLLIDFLEKVILLKSTTNL